MSLFPELVLASNNAGKLREFTRFFAPYQTQIISQSSLGIPSCAEPHITFIENALCKARHASQLSGKPALADDSGICAQALNGAPGVYSARFAGENASDEENNQKMNQELSQHDNKKVSYACSLVLVRHANDAQPIIAQGIWQGEWSSQARGENGFGYDPHFFIHEYQQTAAEISGSLKNRISHRGQALNALMSQLNTLYAHAGLSILPSAQSHLDTHH